MHTETRTATAFLMPRLGYPTDGYLDKAATEHPEYRRILDGMRVEGGRIRHLYHLLGWSPAFLRLWAAFAKGIRDEADLDPALRELMICRIVGLKQATYALGQHRRMANAAGVSTEKLDAVAHWNRSPLFTASERRFLQLGEELALEGQASPGLLDAMRSELGEPATLEALVTGAFYLCVAAVVRSLEPDPEHDEL